MVEEIFDEGMAHRIWPGTRALAQMHLDQGQRVWLVTAAPIEIARIIARRLGLTGALGTVAEHEDGVYTGRLVGRHAARPGQGRGHQGARRPRGARPEPAARRTPTPPTTSRCSPSSATPAPSTPTSLKEAAIQAGIYNQMRDYKSLTFNVGAGQMIKGFDEGVVGMRVGDEKTFTIPPEDAYGEYTEELARELPIDAVDFTPEVGMQLVTDNGLKALTKVSENTFVVDFNHELAGKTLIFLVRIVSVEEREG